MERKTATLLGAAAALVTGGAITAPANASTSAVTPAASYAELLEPIANPVEQLRLADSQMATQQPRLIEADWRPHHHHHHHHHHHY